ncbi:hypothetical protein AI28_24535 [bacteria symbiont BFo1 of Frankliniella occidentalis]|nr:hypothetical protein AI28_24535 [bacteria symbiont BFo1 of Frankliniella occidentalis]
MAFGHFFDIGARMQEIAIEECRLQLVRDRIGRSGREGAGVFVQLLSVTLSGCALIMATAGQEKAGKCEGGHKNGRIRVGVGHIRPE